MPEDTPVPVEPPLLPAEPLPGIEPGGDKVAPTPSPTVGAAAPVNQGTTTIGGVELPSGLTLTIVTDPAGTDATRLYYLTGWVFGVRMSFEVGDQAALNAMFEGNFQDALGMFGVTRVSQTAFDQDYTVMGTSDEIVGSTESLASRVERDIRALGIGQLPAWMRESPRAMAIMALGSVEDWSADKKAMELFKTPAFKRRFSSFAVVAAALGTDHVGSVVDQIARMEADIREAIHEYRGPGSLASTQYLQGLIGTGWSSGEATDILKAEKRLRETPGALENLNAIREFRGEEPLTSGQLTQVMAGSAPDELFESVSDALRQSALAREGVEISAAFAVLLGDDSGDVPTAAQIGETAGIAARAILDFGLELDAGKFGLTKEDILSAAFDRERGAEVDATLAKFARERAAAAQGFGGAQGYVDAEGNLRIPGLRGL